MLDTAMAGVLSRLQDCFGNLAIKARHPLRAFSLLEFKLQLVQAQDKPLLAKLRF